MGATFDCVLALAQPIETRSSRELALLGSVPSVQVLESRASVGLRRRRLRQGPRRALAILGLVCLAAVLAPVRLTPNGSPINVDRQNRSSGTNSEETGIPLVRLSLAIEPLGPNEIAASPLPPVALAGELMRADDRSGEEPHGGN